MESPTELAEDGQLWRNGAVQHLIEQSIRQGGVRQSPGSSSRAIQDNRIDISEFFRNAGPHPDGKQNSRDPSLIGIRKLIIMIPGTLPHH